MEKRNFSELWDAIDADLNIKKTKVLARVWRERSANNIVVIECYGKNCVHAVTGVMGKTHGWSLDSIEYEQRRGLIVSNIFLTFLYDA